MNPKNSPQFKEPQDLRLVPIARSGLLLCLRHQRFQASESVFKQTSHPSGGGTQKIKNAPVVRTSGLLIWSRRKRCPNEATCLVPNSGPTHCNPMGFPRQDYWSGLPFPPPEDLSDLRIEPESPALKVDSLLSESPFSVTEEIPGLLDRPRFESQTCHLDTVWSWVPESALPHPHHGNENNAYIRVAGRIKWAHCMARGSIKCPLWKYKCHIKDFCNTVSAYQWVLTHH